MVKISGKIKEYIRSRLSKQQREKLKRVRRGLHLFYSKIDSSDLTNLAKTYGTDKHGSHFYTTHYEKHFLPFRKKNINLLEIGVGGYDKPNKGGNSLRMWKNFFKRARIYSIDIYDKKALQEERIKIFQGSQVDSVFLKNVVAEIGKINIIIDDGSHINEHVIKSFESLFPKLEAGGIYVIEDIQTSYWPKYGGNSTERNQTNTIMGYFKSLIDGLNHAEYMIPDYQPSYFDKNIVSIQFYHNLIFIYKGSNDEKSSYLIKNEEPK